ncbi:MAG: hypothetical protein OXE58_02945 [Acidobacteria bacterium]|nr:hypothetical protein [Acidobacteriota bacterium]
MPAWRLALQKVGSVQLPATGMYGICKHWGKQYMVGQSGRVPESCVAPALPEDKGPGTLSGPGLGVVPAPAFPG